MGKIQIIPPQGGEGVTPNLQQVTDAGNTTTDNIVVTDGSAPLITLDRPGNRIVVIDPTGTSAGELAPNKLTIRGLAGRGAGIVRHSVNPTNAGSADVTWRADVSGVGALLSDIPAIPTRSLLVSTVANPTAGVYQVLNSDQIVLFFGSIGDIARLPTPATGNTRFSFLIKNMNSVGAVNVDVLSGGNIDNVTTIVLAPLACYTFWCSGGQYYIISR